MKISKIITLVALGFFLMGGMHCHREKEYYISNDTREYFDFPVGSYWVFVNDSLGLTDTVTVTSRNENMVAAEGDKYEQLTLTKYSSYWNQEEFDWIHSLGKDHDVVEVFYSYLSANLTIFETLEFAINPIYFGEESLFIQGNNFPSVAHFRVFDNPDFPNDTIDYWFSKDVGMVKYIILGTDTIYELESCFINN